MFVAKSTIRCAAVSYEGIPWQKLFSDDIKKVTREKERERERERGGDEEESL